MRTVIFFSLLIFGFFAAITAIARPDLIKSIYAELHAPIDKYYADKTAAAWREARNAEYALWMLRLQLPNNCRPPKSSVRELECNNLTQLHAQTFEQNWAVKVNSGWKPEGVAR